MAVCLPAYRQILGSNHYPRFMHRLAKDQYIFRRNEYSYRHRYPTSAHFHATKGPAPQVGKDWVGFSTGNRRIVRPARLGLEAECTDVRNSVLAISIIRLKTTVDMVPNPDITWEYVRNGI